MVLSPDAGSADAHVVDVTESNFEREVIGPSATIPVIVDLWATWCGPCKTLGPTLEALASEYGGAFRLAKVDVDANPGLASAFRAQSIPMVVAIFQGGILDQFVGALPKPEVKRFVDSVLERAGVAPPAPATAPQAPQDPGSAEGFWRQRLAKDPKDAEAALELGKLRLAGGAIAEARELFGAIEATAEPYNTAQTFIQLAGLDEPVQQAGGAEALRDRLVDGSDDAEARLLLAYVDALGGSYEQSLETLIELAATAPAELRQQARKSAGLVLAAAGRGDEAIEQLRRRLSRLLF